MENIKVSEIKTLAELIDVSSEKYGERPLFGYKVGQSYQWMTYREFQKQVERLRKGFHEMGMKSGDVIAIISNNSVPFALTVYAAYGLGASVVPMYEVQKPEDWTYIIQDCGAKYVFVSHLRLAETVESFGLACVEKIIRLTSEKDEEGREFETVESILARNKDGMKRIDIDENCIADILYTSGTTGLPKGVELSHRNIIQNAIHTFAGFDASCADRSLSFLPWAHAFGKTVELHIFPYFGASIALAESPRTIQQNLKEAQPTILVGVPKIFNKFYDKIHQLAQQNRLTQAIIDVTDDLSLKSHTKPLNAMEQIGLKVLHKVLGPKIHEAFGGKLRFCISGGAPLAIEIIQFFDSFGVTIFEGYGMTETSPIVAVNKHGRVKFGSVGRVLDCNRVTIEPVDNGDGTNASNMGEIVVSGECVMKCYHHLPVLTDEVLRDGAFHTGDLGYIDADGYLFLTGRVKEQYKLENGKYVVPGALEEKLKTSPAIEYAILFGAGKPFNVALVRPSEAFISKFVKDKKLVGVSNSELEKNSELNAMIFEEVQKAGKDFRGYEKPSKIGIILDEISIDNGLLTPALKIKRYEVEKRYKSRIEALYG